MPQNLFGFCGSSGPERGIEEGGGGGCFGGIGGLDRSAARSCFCFLFLPLLLAMGGCQLMIEGLRVRHEYHECFSWGARPLTRTPDQFQVRTSRESEQRD
jgi:hypothetical protein